MKVSRREFMRNGLVVAGSAALLSKSLNVGSARAMIRRADLNSAPAIVSPQPFSFGLKDVSQDATTASMFVTNTCYVGQGSRYAIRFVWVPKTFTQIYDAPSAGFVFRLNDWSNYYRVDMFSSEVGIGIAHNGTWTPVMRVNRPISATNIADFSLIARDSTFALRDNVAPGKPVILRWTDPSDTFPSGIGLSPCTFVGAAGTWPLIVGNPA
jgi:hypothetical protein